MVDRSSLFLTWGTCSLFLTMVDPNSMGRVPKIVADDNTYPGGKALAGVWQWICGQLASHVYYAEPFAGKASVFRHKSPALRSWLIDLDPDVITWWHRQARRGTLADVSLVTSNDDRGHRHSRRARPRHVELIHGDGIRFVELAAEWQIPDLLIYADPPYLMSTRTAGAQYKHELTEADHVRLLTAMRGLAGPALISGYPSQLYAEMLKGWRVTTREVITRGRSMRTECLWANDRAARASASVTMEYSELGDCWRERDRISRKVARWRLSFEKLPARERRAILLALLDAARLPPR